MTMQQLVNDLPVMLTLFFTVALGYAIARWLERRSSVEPSKCKTTVNKLAEDGDDEREHDATLPAKDVPAVSKSRAEARKRNRRNNRAPISEPLAPSPEVEQLPSIHVSSEESDSSPIVAAVSGNCVLSGIDAEASTDTSPCWARVEKIKAKKAVRKARKAEIALSCPSLAQEIQKPQAAVDHTETAEHDADIANCNSACQDSTAEDLCVRLCPEPSPATERKVEPELCSAPIIENNSQLTEVSSRGGANNDDSAQHCLAAQPELPESPEAIEGTTWGDAEDSEAGSADGEHMEMELQHSEDKNYADSVHVREDETAAIANRFNDCAVQDVSRTWKEDDTNSKTWWKSKWNSWDDAQDQQDDWMRPFDDLIAVQAGQFQTDVLLCNDNWNQGFDVICQESQQCESGFDMMCPAAQQYDPGMVPLQPFADAEGQQQLYTDGETVYMMMCVEMPETPTDQNLAYANAPSGVNPVGMELKDISMDARHQQVDAGLLTDDDVYGD